MRAKTLLMLVFSLSLVCAMGLLPGNIAWAQETPAETPTMAPETPTEVPIPPTEVPTEVPVVPTEPSVETPTEVPVQPTEPPVETPTEAPPTEVPVPTESPVEVPELIIGAAGGNVGDEIAVQISVANAQDVDAFGFDILQSNNILSLVGVETAGTLTEAFQLVDAQALTDPAGAVRVGAAGGVDAVVNGDGVLLTVTFLADAAGETTLSIVDIVDDLAGAVVTGAVVTVAEVVPPTETPVETPVPTETPVETPVPTEVPPTVVPPTEVPPTETPVETPVPTETPVETPVPTEVPTEIPPTETAVETPVPTETAVETPIPTEVPPTGTPKPTTVGTPVVIPTLTPTPTALTINPALGLVALDELGGTYPRGAAVHNFDIGISNEFGNMVAPGVFDGLPDPVALGPFLFIDGVPIPIAKDMEFTGETLPVAEGGNGSEGAYFLLGGNISTLPPVNPRLGATGGPNRGGIDMDNDPSNNYPFPDYTGDIVPVLYHPEGDSGYYSSPLVDLEPAGNAGFYVLDVYGRIYAEGDALEALDTTVTLTEGSKAVGLKVYRGAAVDLTNSQYSADLIGTGAYVLDSKGGIHVVGTAPAVIMDDIAIVPQDGPAGVYVDIEFMPNPAGDGYMGLAILTGDGAISFAPFEGVDVPLGSDVFIRNISPFGNLQYLFPFNIARDIELTLNDSPLYGLDAQGNTIVSDSINIGFFMFDGYGGTHTGGDATRYAPAYGVGDRIIDGFPAMPFPVTIPYFGVDVTKDVELSWPVQR